MDDKLKKTLSLLQAQCVRREYCVRDIKAKALKSTEGDEAAAQELVESLLQDRFVDDARYAAAFAREKSSIAGWGPVKISYALAAKGIDRQVIAAALEERDESASSARMESVLAAKYRTLKDDSQAKLKLLRFALSRGYNYDQIKDTVETLIEKK